jgi:DNA-directed RNA polymerase III subunit RPC1
MGEPATQMTLKTFHFAGVASMNVTLGVPRIKEIINAAKNISTPIIEAHLVQTNQDVAARIVKGRVEKTTLGGIAKHIQEAYGADRAFLSVELDHKAILALRLDVTAHSVAAAILKHPKLKLKSEHVAVASDSTVVVVPPESGLRARGSTGKEPVRGEGYFALQRLKAELPHVIVQGIPSVSRAVITQDEKPAADGSPVFKLLVEGQGLLEVMGTTGVDAANTVSNHIAEVEVTLGIEAARVMIMRELQKTYGSYGIDIDERHLMLLADTMTYKGEVLGITRFGMAKMKESVFMLASFEKTPDHLFDAAVHSRSDKVAGVSECIIMGTPIPVGTGTFKLLHAPDAPPKFERRAPLMLQDAMRSSR